jgi:hypothetical protein
LNRLNENRKLENDPSVLRTHWSPPLLNTAYQYQLYEMAHASLAGARAVSDAAYMMFRNPFNPWSVTPLGRNVAAGAELFERMTRRYGKPVFGLATTTIDGKAHDVLEEIVWTRPFCNLLRFVRPTVPGGDSQPTLLIVAPMSGHYATLLRGTVEAFLPTHNVYITDWADARMIPLAAGRFDLDDYIDYLRQMLTKLGPGVHMLARFNDADGRPHRHAQEPHGRQPTRGKSRRRLVRRELPANRAVSLSRPRPAGLSRLSATLGLHGDEHGPARQRPRRHVPPPREGRRRAG